MPIVVPIPAFSDNYIWLIKNRQLAIIVDPGDAQPVLQYLQQQQLQLCAILVTHWHGDHTSGIAELVQAYPSCQVYGAAHEKIPSTHLINAESNLTIAELDFQVIQVPGHTLEHIAFYQADNRWLFPGDTLFSAGCGRVFEGSYQQMFNSLQKLASLPPQTQIFPAHEYTLSNLKFTQTIEPNNLAITARINQCEALRKKDLPTLPNTLENELQTNSFLRSTEPEVIQSALKRGAKSAAAIDVFSCLREWKNNF